MKHMSANSAATKFPFGSLVPLWGRQVPYTMIKFVGFYVTAEWIYEQLEKQYGYKQKDLSDSTKLGITFAAGYWAGIFCAIATQPMDNLVSMKGVAENQNKSWGQLVNETGMGKLFTKGLGTRVIMIGTLTGLQWWIYGAFKNAMGFGTQ
jgi:solute carrier family 25 phosphate transporter 3